MSAAGCFLVPTLITYVALLEGAAAAGMRPELVAKVRALVDEGTNALRVARDAGVTMCYGSDLLGPCHGRQLEELAIRAEVLGPAEALRAATSNCARLFQMTDQIGDVAAGFTADLLLVRGEPLLDVGCIRPENLALIIKEGCVFRNTLAHR